MNSNNHHHYSGLAIGRAHATQQEGRLLKQQRSSANIGVLLKRESQAMRKSIQCTAVVAVGLLLVACGKDPEVAKREFMKSGQQYAASGKLKEAIIEYRN